MSHHEIDPIHVLHGDSKAYPGGISALAAEIGRSAGVMHNKFSEAAPQYEVTDREADALALKICATTGARGYIEAKCAMHGGLFVPLPEPGVAADDDVLASLLESMHALGGLARELTEARADGLITLDEFLAFDLRAKRHIARVNQMVLTVRSQVRDEPAAALAAVR